MLKGFENIEKESLFDVISSKREDMENKWKRRKNLKKKKKKKKILK
jgi:hypothetical protein